MAPRTPKDNNVPEPFFCSVVVVFGNNIGFFDVRFVVVFVKLELNIFECEVVNVLG